MANLDRRAAWLLVAVLAMVAVVGFGQGLARALNAPRPEQAAAGVDPSRDPVPNASPLTGPVLDEARVRQIAREEASAALGAARKKAAPKPAEVDPDAAAPMTTVPSIPVTPAPTLPPPAAAPSVPPG